LGINTFDPEKGVIVVTKWKVKSCPRCGGDMFVDRDLDCWYEQCLQCSYRIELRKLDYVKEPVSSRVRASNDLSETEETKPPKSTEVTVE